jgi:hypothetical protein
VREGGSGGGRGELVKGDWGGWMKLVWAGLTLTLKTPRQRCVSVCDEQVRKSEKRRPMSIEKKSEPLLSSLPSSFPPSLPPSYLHPGRKGAVEVYGRSHERHAAESLCAGREGGREGRD